MKKRYQDTLIDSLERKVYDWEEIYKASSDSWNTLLSIERKKLAAQVDLTNVEISLRKFYQQEGRKFKRQRNWGIVIGVLSAGYAIFRPP